MNPRRWLWSGVIAVLGATYVWFFTDWLNPTPIGISAQIRANAPRGAGMGPGGRAGRSSRAAMNNGGGAGGGGGRNRRAEGAGGGGRARGGGGGPRMAASPFPEDAPPTEGGSPDEAGRPRVYPVSFALDCDYHLTSIKVVKAGTTKALWHLVPAGDTEPTKALIYGQPVRGMKAAPDSPQPAPLQPNVKYELQLQAGRHKGKTTFETKEIPTSPEVAN